MGTYGLSDATNVSHNNNNNNNNNTSRKISRARWPTVIFYCGARDHCTTAAPKLPKHRSGGRRLARQRSSSGLPSKRAADPRSPVTASTVRADGRRRREIFRAISTSVCRSNKNPSVVYRYYYYLLILFYFVFFFFLINILYDFGRPSAEYSVVGLRAVVCDPAQCPSASRILELHDYRSQMCVRV